MHASMFSNYESEVVGFSSNWKMDKTTSDGESQTTEFSSTDNVTSTIPARSVGAQTDPIVPPLKQHPTTPPGLAAWLQNIAPLVMKELRVSEGSTAFRGYDPYRDDNEEDVKAKLLQTFRAEVPRTSATTPQTDADNKLPVMSISWSCAGNTLAVGTGRLYHEDWCQHEGSVHIYTSGRTEELKHSSDLKLAACTSMVCFHPTEPALLAAATVSGSIYVWNLQQQDMGREPLVASVSTHAGRSTAGLLWLERIRGHPHEKVLVSAGSDGKVILWIVNSGLSSLTQKTCFELYGSSVSISMQPPDISCLDFSRSGKDKQLVDDTGDGTISEDYFAVGCKTGEVIVCRCSSAKTIAASSGLDPTVAGLEPHRAAVLAVSFCSQHARILLTLGADKEIRMYDILQVTPIKVIHSEHGLSIVKWVPSDSKALLLAAMARGSSDRLATLQVLSVTSGQEIQVEGLQELEMAYSGSLHKPIECGLTCLSFNTKNMNKVACGDMDGSIKIWNIPFQDVIVPNELDQEN